MKLERITASGVPVQALSAYGRWWQLENWLRDVVYLELRAKWGVGWHQHLHGPTTHRAAKEGRIEYMASADRADLLTYSDTAVLFDLISAHWELFERTLLPRPYWEGLETVLRDLRHRVAHCRRPHSDDVGRLEQTLRDLESGARRWHAAYAEPINVFEKTRDPVVMAWIGQRHPAAARLVEHCASQYDVRLRLAYSVRPWDRQPLSDVDISGSEGVLWHAHWLLGPHDLSPRAIWERIEEQPALADLVVHLLQAHSGDLMVTFAAVDDPTEVADAIGHIFDYAITSSRSAHWDRDADLEAQLRTWRAEGEGLPRKVHVGTPLALYDPNQPFSFFGAEPPGQR